MARKKIRKRDPITKKRVRDWDMSSVLLSASGTESGLNSNITEIALAPQVLRDVINHRDSAKDLLTGWGKGLIQAGRTGNSVRMTVIVDPHGSIATLEVEDVEQPKDDLSAALAAARACGVPSIDDILGILDVLGANRFAKRPDTSRNTVHQRRKRGEVLGLEGRQRGVRSQAGT